MLYVEPTLPESPSLLPSRERSLREDMQSRIRVLLVDDHAMLRQGLRSLVDGYDYLEVAGEASNGLEAIDAVRTLRPDVVVKDINMPNAKDEWHRGYQAD